MQGRVHTECMLHSMSAFCQLPNAARDPKVALGCCRRKVYLEVATGSMCFVRRNTAEEQPRSHLTSPDSIAAPSSPLATSYPRRTSMPGAAVKRVTGTPCRWGLYGRGCSASAARTYALVQGERVSRAGKYDWKGSAIGSWSSCCYCSSATGLQAASLAYH